MGHNIQHTPVSLIHRISTDADEVADAAVHVFVDDAFHAAHAVSLHGEHGGKYCRADAGGEFQRTTGLRTVANHAREVGNHVLHGVGHLKIVPTHQVGDAATGTRGSHDTTAKGRERTEVLLDVDGGQV